MSTRGLLNRLAKLEQLPIHRSRLVKHRDDWEVSGRVPNAPGPVREICRQEAILMRAKASLPGDGELFLEYADQLDEVAADPAKWAGREFAFPLERVEYI